MQELHSKKSLLSQLLQSLVNDMIRSPVKTTSCEGIGKHIQWACVLNNFYPHGRVYPISREIYSPHPQKNTIEEMATPWRHSEPHFKPASALGSWNKLPRVTLSFLPGSHWSDSDVPMPSASPSVRALTVMNSHPKLTTWAQTSSHNAKTSRNETTIVIPRSFHSGAGVPEHVSALFSSRCNSPTKQIKLVRDRKSVV